MPENCAETRPSLPVGTRLEGVPPTSHGYLVQLPAKRCQNTWPNRADSLYAVRSWEAKMEIPASWHLNRHGDPFMNVARLIARLGAPRGSSVRCGRSCGLFAILLSMTVFSPALSAYCTWSSSSASVSYPADVSSYYVYPGLNGTNASLALWPGYDLVGPNSGCIFTTVSSASWIVITANTGAQDFTCPWVGCVATDGAALRVAWAVSSNPSPQPRTATITITGAETPFTIFINQAGCTGSTCGAAAGCGDERDQLIRDYVFYKVQRLAGSGKTLLPFVPSCSDFTNKAHSQYFTFVELNVPSPQVGPVFSWALLEVPLLTGIDAWRVSFENPMHVNSGYREPFQNALAGGASQSQHMYGTAVDIQNPTRDSFGWSLLAVSALQANVDWIEPSNGPCKLACVHGDWRDTVGPYAQ